VARCVVTLAMDKQRPEYVTPAKPELEVDATKPSIRVRRQPAQPDGWVRVVYDQPRLDN
jgi:hypothetical protein